MGDTLPHDDIGSGKPLVLLHAGIADRRMWAQHLEPFAAAGFRVVAPDLPGFGDAPVAPSPEAPWLDVLAMLDELGIDNAALAGNSFGAGVALRAAVTAPSASPRSCSCRCSSPASRSRPSSTPAGRPRAT